MGDGPVRVDMYIDFLCPFCQRFELNAADALAALTENHQATLVYHPMNFLDEASTTRYSTRASAAAGCASDLGRFVEFTHQMFVQQPEEGGPGLSDTEIARVAQVRRAGPVGLHLVHGPGALPGLARFRDRPRGRRQRARHPDRPGERYRGRPGRRQHHRRRSGGSLGALT